MTLDSRADGCWDGMRADEGIELTGPLEEDTTRSLLEFRAETGLETQFVIPGLLILERAEDKERADDIGERSHLMGERSVLGFVAGSSSICLPQGKARYFPGGAV
jgi:hypothetical protein